MKKQVTEEGTFAIEVLNLRERVNQALKKEGICTLEDILNCQDEKIQKIVYKISKSDYEEILKFKENSIEQINYKLTLRLKEILKVYKKFRVAARSAKIRYTPLAMKKAFFSRWNSIPNELILSKIEKEKGVFEEEFIQNLKNNKYPKFKELFSATKITNENVKAAILEDCRTLTPYIRKKYPNLEKFVEFVKKF